MADKNKIDHKEVKEELQYSIRTLESIEFDEKQCPPHMDHSQEVSETGKFRYADPCCNRICPFVVILITTMRAIRKDLLNADKLGYMREKAAEGRDRLVLHASSHPAGGITIPDQANAAWQALRPLTEAVA